MVVWYQALAAQAHSKSRFLPSRELVFGLKKQGKVVFSYVKAEAQKIMCIVQKHRGSLYQSQQSVSQHKG